MSFEKLCESLSYLPIAEVADEVVLSVASGAVTILTGATGSGKTLLTPARLADLLQADDEQVVVLVPRRFLAVNAAETIADIEGCEVGGLVGYAIGSQSGDRSNRSKETKLLFVTNGYAISSGLVHTATTFVLDEVHETTMDLSIVRALLRRRIEQGESIRVLEMSATMDAFGQARYWESVAQTKVFQIDGRTFPCEVRHRPAGNIAEQVIELIQEGRRGILVFRPGAGEVQDTATEIEEAALVAGIEIEVAEIYGEMDYQQRSEATRAPGEDKIKVLVGTNVVESGVNIAWFDAGVTCGTGKENSVRPETGATYLKLIQLPQWRLDQQEGRIKRFRPGIFVLCSPYSYAEREISTTPEIERLALTELVMHCASFGLRTHDLTFDYVPQTDKVVEAERKLQRLGLIDLNCTLTKAGNYVANLPVGPETGAMLWHAVKTNCLPQAIGLAAIVEVGGIRKDFRIPHYLDHTSDYLDGLMALQEARSVRGGERRKLLEERNIGYRRYEAACDLGSDLERKLKQDASFELSDLVKAKLRQCILAGSLDRLFTTNYDELRPLIGSRYNSYRVGQGSAIGGRINGSLVAGNLRVITPKDSRKSPFTVVEKVTIGNLEDLLAIAKVRPEILTEVQPGESDPFSLRGDFVAYKLFGEYLLPAASPSTGNVLDWEADEDSWGSPGYGRELRRY